MKAAARFLREHWLLVAGVVAALSARIAFWAYTDRVWEDALITVAHARNAVEGLGLTHHPGEGPVHGFTSALSVLIPLLGEAVAEGSGITALRIASLIAAAISITYAYLIARQLRLTTWPIVFILGFLALAFNHVFFGMAGMETQVGVAILLGSIHAVLSGHPFRSGFLAGLSVLARPEFAIWAGVVLVAAFRRRGRPVLRTAFGISVPLLPWLAFTVAYYGSPIPHTIRAKAAVFSSLPEGFESLGLMLAWVGERLVDGLKTFLRLFMPFYSDSLVMAAPTPLSLSLAVSIVILLLGLVGAWSMRRRTDWRPVGVFIGALILYWTVFVPYGYFDWYQPPLTAVVAMLCGIGMDALPSPEGVRASLVRGVTATALVAFIAIPLVWQFPLEREIQVRENRVRSQVGLYLADRIPNGEAVVAEAAGYLGYYGHVELWDFPGLTSPTALRATLAHPKDERSLSQLIADLDPPRIVLRPKEWAAFGSRWPSEAACYSVDRGFGQDGPDLIAANGLTKWNQDRSFAVYRRDACDIAGG